MIRRVYLGAVMDEAWKDWRYWAMLIIGLVAGWIGSTWPGLVVANGAKSWWDIATAGGTVAAVCVALWQAKRASFAFQESETRRANLVAAAVGHLVAQRMEAAKYVAELLELLSDGTDDEQKKLGQVVAHFQRIDLTLPIETLMALAPLPLNCADNLAAGLGSIDATRNDILLWSADSFFDVQSLQERKKQYLDWSYSIDTAFVFMCGGLEILQTSSNSGLRRKLRT